MEKLLNVLEREYPCLADDGIRRFMLESDSFYPPDAVALSSEQQRVLYNNMCAHFRKPRPEGVQVNDTIVAHGKINVPVRVYSPVAYANKPVALYLHGGGFTVGDLESHDDICAEIANRTIVTVIAVAYRLAPEHPFPAAFGDCKSVLNALPDLAQRFQFDASRIVIAGDSAGGNLAAALSIDARDRGEPAIAGQVLIYPGLGGDTSAGSYVTQSEAPGLSTKDLEFYQGIYIGSADSPNHQSKFVSPLLESDYRGLPPAFLVAAHYDPLCDDCAEYARQLEEAGVAAKVREEPLLVHAFLRARHLSQPASTSFDAIVHAIEMLAYNGELP